MPWIDTGLCKGCGVCVKKCPATAITMSEKKAAIDMKKCFRCGECHDACKFGAVRHDGDRIPEEVEANINKVRGFMEHFDKKEKKQGCLKRNMKFYMKEIKVAENTLEKLRELAGE